MSPGEPATTPVDLRHAQGVIIGDYGLQVNVFPPRREKLRPWMLPVPPGPVTPRPELSAAIFDAVSRDRQRPAAQVTTIEGTGGFGKTTLAASLCQDPRVADLFPGGLLWVTVGEDSAGARLAEKVGGLCEVLSGESIKTADPQAAGGQLGEQLDARAPILLVIDDIWRPEQLAPFLIGGNSCRRLVTTRNVGVAPRRGVSVLVDEMTTEQAAVTLTEGIGEIPGELRARLIAITGRWPLLLGIVNAALADHIAVGAEVGQAARWVLRQLEASGPAALDTDLGDEEGRGLAVAATMRASFALLTPEERERYLDLAVIPDDATLPATILTSLWNTATGLSAPEAERLRSRLVRLRLVQPGWDADEPSIRLHSVIGAYLRHQLTTTELAARHNQMIRNAIGFLPRSPDSIPAWWTLPPGVRYLWHRLPHHLARADRGEEHDALVTDLRWIEAQISALGSSVAAEADLAETSGAVALALRRALGSVSALLTPGNPATVLGATLNCYLSGVPALDSVVSAYQPVLPVPRFAPAWTPPDQPGGEVLRTITGHGSGVSHCVFAPDGSVLATASHDRTIRVWNVTTGQLVQTLAGHDQAVLACAFSPDGTQIASASHDLTARTWDRATGTQRLVLTGHTAPVTACSYAPDGTQLATASQDGTIRIWDLRTGTTLTTLAGHDQAVSACAFSPDGTQIASASHDLTARTWDRATGTQRLVLTGHTAPVTACSYAPDGTQLATASQDGTIRIWDLRTGTTLTTLAGHDQAVSACAFSPDGTQIASASHDLTARTWSTVTGRQIAVLSGHSETVTCCAFSPRDSILATASHDWKVQLWQTSTESARSQHALHWEYTCAISPDGAIVASAGYGRAVRLWDLATGDLRQTLQGHTDTVAGCSFSSDGTMLATASHDRTIRLWDTRTGAARATLEGHGDAVTDCDFAPDGTLLASASHDDTVRLWDLATGQLVRSLTGHTGAVSACAFSPDGELVAAASHDHTLRLWETATGLPRAVLTGHADLVSGCCFAPDGTRVASSSHDGTARIWDAASGRQLQVLHQHTSGLSDCAFAPDGALITADIGERWLRMWRPGDAEPVCGLRVLTPVLRLAWHPAQPLVCGVGESGVYLFRLIADS